MSALDQIDCTRIGRYSSGEIPGGFHGGRHPIAQFIGGDCYSFDGPKYSSLDEVPSDASKLPSRIDQFSEETIEIVDVGCSTGGATLSFLELLRHLTNKRINLQGYDNDRTTLDTARRGDAMYDSTGCLLHEKVLDVVKEHFNVKEVYRNTDPRRGYVNGNDDVYELTLKPKSAPLLESILNYGEADNLPLSDDFSHLTICTFVLRYADNQEDIFNELARITRPGGYIFTEEYALQKEDKGVRFLHPSRNDAAISFYDTNKIIHYWPLSPGGEHDKEFLPRDLMSCIISMRETFNN